MTIKLIGFDLDDTLYPMRPTLLNAEARLGDWLAANCAQLNYSVVEMRAFSGDLLRQDPSLAADVSRFRRRVIEQALLASDYPADRALSLSARAFAVFLDARNQVAFFEGALQALAQLKLNCKLAALTNGNADIERLGLSRFFSFALSAADVGAPKPAPDLFTAALTKAGVSPQEMVYVGDHPIQDMQSANALGLYTVWVNLSERTYDATTAPTRTVTDLRDLPAAIATIT